MSETDGTPPDGVRPDDLPADVPPAGELLPFVWRGVRIDATVDARAGRLDPGWWLLGWRPSDVELVPDAEAALARGGSVDLDADTADGAPGPMGTTLPAAAAVVALPVMLDPDVLAAERRMGLAVGTARRVVAELETALMLHRLSGLRPPN